MTKKQRSFLFFLLISLFVIVGPSAVLYSQGYRIDFENKKIVQTGAFYFRISPKSVQIEIKSFSRDNKRLRSTDFIFGTTYIENLLPKRYEIKVTKNNYHDWRKTLEIKEKMATEIKDITLIPKDPKFKIESDIIDDFFYFPDKNIFIVKKQKDDSWSLSKQEIKSEKFIDFFTTLNNENLIDVKVLNKDNYLIIETKKGLKNNYYLINTEKEEDLIVLDFPEKIKNIKFRPKESDFLIFQKENELFTYDYKTKKINSFLNDVLAYSFDLNQEFFWISNDGFLMKNIDNPIKINKKSLDIENEEDNLEIIFPNFSKTIVKINSDFYFLNEKNLFFEKTFTSKSNPIISPDLNKLTYYTESEARVLFLEEINDQPQKKSMENVFLTRFSKELKNINWFTSHYIVFTIDNEIKIIEIDDRDNINLINLAVFDNPKIIFNLLNKKLYVLSENKLSVSDKLVF